MRSSDGARPGSVTRRDALRLGVAGAAATALGACSDGGRDASPHPTARPAGATRRAAATTRARPDPGAARRVLVVGAGLAGLTAAVDLVDAGWDVRVLEARDRVGGRVHTVRGAFSEAMHAEAGGESIDDDHTHLLALVRRFGLRTEARPADKYARGVTHRHGRRWHTADFLAQRGGLVARDFDRFFTALDDLSRDLDPEHPERFGRAGELDGRSLQDFIDGLHLDPDAAFLAQEDSRSEYNTEPRRLSLLFAAQQTAAGPDIADSGVEHHRITGGNDLLPGAMARHLGGRVVLGAPVSAIAHDRAGVRISAGGRVHDGAWAIVACPFMPLRHVRFTPRLPPALAAAVGGLDLGQAAKVTVEYGERFWERGNTSGFTETDLPIGIAWSPTDSYRSTAGLLTAFITGDAAAAAARQPPATRTAQAADQLDRIYPEGRSLRTGRTATTAWADERYTGGGYAAYRPGQLAPFWPAIRTGTGRIRFAGEHTEALAGYMESAVRSGRRVAAALGRPPR